MKTCYNGGSRELVVNVLFYINVFVNISILIFEPCRGKIGFLRMGKQRRRSADQRLCFRYTDRKIPLVHKSGISIL